MKRLLPTWASALLVAIAIVGALAMLARAALAAECPNKFGDQKEVSAGAENDEDAKTELAKLLKKALDDAAAECKDKTCTETKAKCRFVHTVTKVNCKDAPAVPGGPKRMCSQKYRPGCFCLKEDETIELKAVKPARTEKSNSAAPTAVARSRPTAIARRAGSPRSRAKCSRTLPRQA